MFRFLIALIALTGASAFSVGPASCPALIRHSIATNSLDVQMGRGDKRTAKGARSHSRSRAEKIALPFVLQNSLFTHALFSFPQASARRAPTATRGPRIRSCESVRPRRRTAAARRSKVGAFTRNERQCMCVAGGSFP